MEELSCTNCSVMAEDCIGHPISHLLPGAALGLTNSLINNRTAVTVCSILEF